jgi:hypothetical protein
LVLIPIGILANNMIIGYQEQKEGFLPLKIISMQTSG